VLSWVALTLQEGDSGHRRDHIKMRRGFIGINVAVNLLILALFAYGYVNEDTVSGVEMMRMGSLLSAGGKCSFLCTLTLSLRE
jgi:hypothetical protein